MRNRGNWAVAVLCVLAGCGDDGHGPSDAAIDAVDAPPDAEGTIDPRPQVAEIYATPNRDLDLLFVVDDSPSMQDKQANLAANFPNFVNVLTALPGGLPNLHLGVVSTDMGTKGTDVAQPGPPIGSLGNGGCSMTGKGGRLTVNGAAVSDAYVSDIKLTDGSRQRNYTGTLATVFSQMARLGGNGCGFEQPLHAMKVALDGNAANVGFLRPNALLAVVFVTDEDDCSIADPAMFGPASPTLGPLQSFRCTRFGVTCQQGGQTSDAMNQIGPKTGCSGSVGSTFMSDVAPYAQFLKTLKGDTRLVATAAIVGNTTPVAVELRTPPGGGTAMPALAHSCTYQGSQGQEVADPAVRIQQFLTQFPNRHVSSTICQQDLSAGLGQIGQLLTQSIGNPCITRQLADLDPGTPGLQPDCVVEDIVGSTITRIPACGSAPCWRFETDPATCTVGDHLKLVIDRPQAPDPATVTTMRCAVP
ncbi:MAG: hypothetical protein JNL83_28320 [Myxococcales bacterium]|nr:hypothetical protein [Myxococcales bacterium]